MSGVKEDSKKRRKKKKKRRKSKKKTEEDTQFEELNEEPKQSSKKKRKKKQEQSAIAEEELLEQQQEQEKKDQKNQKDKDKQNERRTEKTQDKSSTPDSFDESYTESKFSASLPAPDLPNEVGGINVESYTDKEGVVRVRIADDVPMEAIYVPELNAYQYKVKGANGKDTWMTLQIPPPPPSSLDASAPRKTKSQEFPKNVERKKLKLLQIRSFEDKDTTSLTLAIEPTEDREYEPFKRAVSLIFDLFFRRSSLFLNNARRFSYLHLVITPN